MSSETKTKKENKEQVTTQEQAKDSNNSNSISIKQKAGYVQHTTHLELNSIYEKNV